MSKESVYQINDNDFISAIKHSKNIHEALVKMGLNSRGAAYKTFNLRCEKLNIDLSHFITGKNLRKILTQKEIKSACKDSFSRQETLKTLGLNPHTGANISWIEKQIINYNIDTSHWLGMGHLKNKSHNWNEAIPLSEILVENSKYLNGTNIKKKLLKANLLKYQCYRCGINTWLNEPLSLQLEHKNGNHRDNRIENLCLLCPNCHSLTETFGSKNIKK